MLTVDNVSKRFGGTQALLKARLEVVSGEVHALVGGNGSGKSTLIKCLAGVYQADEGTATVGESTVALAKQTPELASQAGLLFVHQDLGIFPSLNVTENLFIRSTKANTRWGRLDARRARAATDVALQKFGLRLDPRRLAGALSPPEKALLAIARALLERPSTGKVVLMLDEPTASLSRREAGALIDAIREFASAGDAILFVSHRLDEVRRIADRVTAFRDGRYVATRPAEGLTNADLAELIVGQPGSIDDLSDKHTRIRDNDHQQAPPVLLVDHLAGGPVEDVSFEVNRGEILGIAGLVGSGRSEVLRMIYGLMAHTGGSITYRGQPVEGQTPAAARSRGIAFISEDRLGEGIFGDRSVCDNLVTGDDGRYFRSGFMRTSSIKADSRADVARYRIRTQSVESPIENLSGGNQQKVVLARWLRLTPQLLLLDEPTQGVDVGARQEIYHLIASSVSTGTAVIVVSSEFEELALLCDRVIVLAGGRMTTSFSRPIEEADLVSASIGLYQGEGRFNVS